MTRTSGATDDIRYSKAGNMLLRKLKQIQAMRNQSIDMKFDIVGTKGSDIFSLSTQPAGDLNKGISRSLHDVVTQQIEKSSNSVNVLTDTAFHAKVNDCWLSALREGVDTLAAIQLVDRGVDRENFET